MVANYGRVWADILDQRLVDIAGANATYAAHGQREGLKDRYIFLIESCREAGTSFAKAKIFLTQAINDANFISFTKVTDHADGAYLSSAVAIPKFRNEEIASIAREDPKEYSRYGICAIYSEIAKVNQNLGIIDISDNNPEFLEYYIRYIQYKSINSEYGEIAPEIQPLSDEVKNIRTAIDQTIDQINTKTKDFNAVYSESTTKLSENIAILERRVATAQTAYEAFKAEISEKLKLKSAGGLWAGRAKANLTSFKIATFCTIAILVATALFIVLGHDVVSQYIFAVGASQPDGIDGVPAIIAQIRQLLFVTVPLIVIVWIARFGMRYALRALSLHDDATQREVMLDTYLFLTGQGQAQEEHRVLMLNALFRPLPGQAIQDVEPPNWAELMIAAKDK